MLISEIFKSIQGESTHAGRICSFVRLSGCNLRCLWCDTPYAQQGGEEKDIAAVVDAVKAHATSLVEITGGEPLLQEETPLLCKTFVDLGFTVLVETNGSCDISGIPRPAIRIVDIKCPSSGQAGSFLEKNLALLRRADECKFVVADKTDFLFALDTVNTHVLHEKSAVLFSPVKGALSPRELAEWIVSSNAPVRLNLQLHKLLWGEKRGV